MRHRVGLGIETDSCFDVLENNGCGGDDGAGWVNNGALNLPRAGLSSQRRDKNGKYDYNLDFAHMQAPFED